ncbi:MAG: caspase family protein, partial [Bacteroidetes bacterium]|nr:caspase family protein [Bacteroidota bacterium]
RAYDDKNNFGDSTKITLKWTGSKVKEKDLPNLYAVLVGVSEYENPKLKLNWAAKDAEDLNVLLKAQSKEEGGKIFNKVITKLITDSNATREGILGGLTWLNRNVTDEDFALFYYSGHGDNPYRKFHLIPVDADISNADKLAATGLSQAKLLEWIGPLNGKKIVILDACRSKSAFDGVVVGLGYLENAMAGNNGTVMFSSSASGELSYECKEEDMCNNGYFTHILLKGMKGEADGKYDPRGFIQANEITIWMKNEVELFTKDKIFNIDKSPNPQQANVVASQEWQNEDTKINLAWWDHKPSASRIP